MRALWNPLILMILFFIDVCGIGMFGSYALNTVLIYSIISFLYQHHSNWFYTAFFLLGLESVLVFDLFGFTYLYLIPLFALLKITTYYLASKEVAALIMLFTTLLCQTLFLAYFKLDTAPWGNYTLYLIGANLLILFISLKWFSTVEQGNRF